MKREHTPRRGCRQHAHADEDEDEDEDDNDMTAAKNLKAAEPVPTTSASDSRAREPDCAQELVTRQGARARLDCDDDGAERLAVLDRRGHLMFEYHAGTGRGMLVAAEGDMRLFAPRGAIELHAARGIRAHSAGEVSLTSATQASVGVEGAGATRLSLSSDAAVLTSDTLAVSAQRSELRLGKTRAWAEKLHASVDRAELRFGKVLRRADRVIEQAGNYYQRVGELCEVKAGRLRTLVSGHVWLKGQDIAVHADERVKIDGKHINLG